MCSYKVHNASRNQKAYRLKSYLNIITPAVCQLLQNTVLARDVDMSPDTRRKLVSDLVQMKISLSWIGYYGEVHEAQYLMDGIRTLCAGDLTTQLSPYLIANYFLALLRFRPIV
jgi:hypothetical protein